MRDLNRNNTSGYIGVTWVEERQKWKAQIWVHGKMICLGYFDDKKEAALVYNYASLKYHGINGCLNLVF